MRVQATSGAAGAARSDLLVSLNADGERPEVPAPFAEPFGAARRAGDLPKGFRKQRLLYPVGRSPHARLLLVSAGQARELDAERLRRLAALAVRRAAELGAKRPLLAPSRRVAGRLAPADFGRAVAEGAVLGSYRYVPPSKERAKPSPVSGLRVAWPGGRAPAALRRGLTEGAKRAAAVAFARDLGNRAANLLTPSQMAREARKLAGGRIRVRVLGEPEMRRLKMGALLGVARGSKEPARLIVLDYRPPRAQETLCVVGKGLTFDAGGISLKPSAGMDEMRYDMCGAAAVLGLFHALAHGALSPDRRVVGLVPAAENLPDGAAQKPGDVVTACDGTTIEVLNTDAEGRLVLADALAYARKTFEPDAIVDLATLTGAVIIALGHEVAGLLGNDARLLRQLERAGEKSGDRVWPLPLWDVHREQMKSRFADVKNINKGRAEGGGSIAGAAFLSYFVGETPWAHVDIAGAAWGQKTRDDYQGGATGVGVRLLLDWLAAR